MADLGLEHPPNPPPSAHPPTLSHYAIPGPCPNACPTQKGVSSWVKGDQSLLFVIMMMVYRALSHIYGFVRFASQLPSPCLHLPPVDNVI